MNLSIVIPCHNLENYIEKCLDTILSQNIEEYICEIIFVCDACTDETKQVIINKMVKQDKFSWKILTCNFENPGETRNLGLENAQGILLWFIDGDDWLLNDNIILEAINNFNNNDIDAIKFDYETKLFKTDVAVWRYIFRRDFLKDIRFNNKAIFEDEDFMKEVKAKKPKIVDLKNIYYHYNHPREGSIVTTYLKKSNLHGRPPWRE